MLSFVLGLCGDMLSFVLACATAFVASADGNTTVCSLATDLSQRRPTQATFEAAKSLAAELRCPALHDHPHYDHLLWNAFLIRSGAADSALTDARTKRSNGLDARDDVPSVPSYPSILPDTTGLQPMEAVSAHHQHLLRQCLIARCGTAGSGPGPLAQLSLVPATSSTPDRLRADGANLIDSSGTRVQLNGVNVWADYGFEDTEVVSLFSHLPSVNVVRLVSLYWEDSSCKTAQSPFVDEACLTKIQSQLTNLNAHNGTSKVWMFITARAPGPAGDDADNLFGDHTMLEHFKTMWSYVAMRFAGFEGVGGLEILSEPRDKGLATEDQTRTAAFYGGVCDAIRRVDSATPCVIGPAAFYKVWNMGPTLLIPDNNTIYTFDFFLPEVRLPIPLAVAWTPGGVDSEVVC